MRHPVENWRISASSIFLNPPTILLRLEVPFVGLGLGNYDWDKQVEVVLPNGKPCPPSDHQIPDFDFGDQLMGRNPAVVEADGVVYLCGGAHDDTGSTGEEKRLFCSLALGSGKQIGETFQKRILLRRKPTELW